MDKSLFALAQQLVARPKFHWLLKRVTGLQSFPLEVLREWLVAAADADKFRLHDQILAEGDAREARRQQRRRDHLAAGGKGPPPLEDDDLAILTGGVYHIDGRRWPLELFLKGQGAARAGDFRVALARALEGYDEPDV